MNSMTGFGFGRSSTKQSEIEVTVRAVNGRYMEARFHSPRELLVFESELRTELQKVVQRGTIDVYIARKLKLHSIDMKIELNETLVTQYSAAVKKMAKMLKQTAQPKVELIARMPDVLRVEAFDAVDDDEGQALRSAMKLACEACRTEREREGRALAGDLQRLTLELRSLVARVEKLRDEANIQIKERLEAKMKARAAELTVEPQRLAQELIIYLEKSDINEEVVRLREHLDNYEQVVAAPGLLGKKLEFYTQELLREINTIGSKSGNSALTQVVVEAKTVVERLREQVQNVE